MNKPGKFLSDSMSHQLAVTAGRVAKLFAAQYAATGELTTNEWRVLAALAEKPNATSTDVCDVTGIDKAGVSRAVVRLTSRKLIKRVVSSKDGRRNVLSLTRKGVAAHSTAMGITRSLEASLAAGLNEADLAALQKGLDLLSRQAGALSGLGEFGTA